MKPIRVGIFFGGNSREREISFAGGRTVYDNLNKALFEPVPIFVDSFGHLIKLDWSYLYKGSIRDFYPPAEFVVSPNGFQFYAESLNPKSSDEEKSYAQSLGTLLRFEDLKNEIDVAFLALHGVNGEDGRLQGVLEWYQIPYTGSGILPSSFGMNKAIQKEFMDGSFVVPQYIHFTREEWLNESNKRDFYHQVLSDVGLPMVVKSANQGSSIGISVVDVDDFTAFYQAVQKSLFIETITAEYWNNLSNDERVQWIRNFIDIRSGIGLPVFSETLNKTIYHPENLLDELNVYFQHHAEDMVLEALEGECEILVESFIPGKEFSCIVVENMNGTPLALPPTGIVKGQEIFDYRSKYLPGLSRKVTPIELESNQIEAIRTECVRLYTAFHFNVYARIDGFYGDDGKIYLNDPNTTSGMMPSSFFFHQAAEIGLNPSQFLTYIIRTSINTRGKNGMDSRKCLALVDHLDSLLYQFQQPSNFRKNVAVIMGGYSSERHISVESGRNVYEKLASSGKYNPISVFLKGDAHQFTLFALPINLHLKDNADDISEKIDHFSIHPIIQKIQLEAHAITDFFASGALNAPVELNAESLKNSVDEVFIALHGRPGEDGTLQKELIQWGIPFNGSLPSGAALTIDKYETKEVLKKHGFVVAKHRLVDESSWINNQQELVTEIESEFPYPFIAKPVDDGCSSAVKKIKNKNELLAFCRLIFRKQETLMVSDADTLGLKYNEEFPLKKVFLIEEFIQANGATHFLEVTGGMLTHFENGNIVYETFEPSESVADSEVLSLEEKFLAGEGLNITPARYDKNKTISQKISNKVQSDLGRAAQILGVTGYCRIDAFVRIYDENNVETVIIEVNSLPGMTPATCIFHQCALNGYKPFEFIDSILKFGEQRRDYVG
jgi:UDP-N-acetylmuramate--alanine ligase